MNTIRNIKGIRSLFAPRDPIFDDIASKIFVGRNLECAELRKAIASNTPTVLVGRSGAGKSTLIEFLRSEIETYCPGGTFRVDSKGGSSEILAFINKYIDGFRERTFLEVDNSRIPLKQKEFSNLFLSLSKIQNLQVVATVLEPIKGLEAISQIFLSPINPRELLEARVKCLSKSSEKEKNFVTKAFRAIDQVTASAPTNITPQEAIKALKQAMQVWDSEHSLLTEPPSESIVISTLQNYLRTRADYLGLAVAIVLYFLSTASDQEHESLALKRNEALVQKISMLVQQENSTSIKYFTSTPLNLRTGPGESYNIIRVLPKEQELEVLATAKIWFQIEIPGTEEQGWVHAKYVTPVVTTQSSNKNT